MEVAQNHWQIEKLSQECFGLWLKLKDYVDLIAQMPDDQFEEGEMTETEARSRWSSITMNLAFVLSKCRKLSGQQLDQALGWLHQLIEDKVGGGAEATSEVCKFAHASLVRNN